jgi:penicillin G amidase
MTKLPSNELLLRLGRGESIAVVCAAAGLSRPEFDAWWRQECARRVPQAGGARQASALTAQVRIERDRWGVPHIYASNDRDLFFGFGYAVAQDRLFQLDYLRRKARGRLAEVLGPEAIESDLLYRTIGLGTIAEAEWAATPEETRALLTAYADGVNAVIVATAENLPIEFALLDYRPGPWLPSDCLAIVGEFRWYLTGRFPVIAIPEMVKRAVGDGPLYRAFVLGEDEYESILIPGEYRPGPAAANSASAVGSADEGHGSNNWVLSGARSTSGKPIVANDPHIPFAAVSIWHQVRLSGGSFDVAGVALAGMPAVMIGRGKHVAWGITNNICSQRDLYQEKTDTAQPNCYFDGERWSPATTREEVIAVKGVPPVRKVVRMSRNGPIVDEVLPAPVRGTGPVSLRWLGAEPCGWLTALLNMNRAQNCAEFRAATRPWSVPTFNLVFADTDGHFGFQSVGRIPIRRVAERGYRSGWEARHQWDGFIPFEEMPRLVDPARGFAVTANNRVAPDDFPYPLSGTWNSGHRAARLRGVIEAAETMSARDCQTLQYDTYSNRAAACVQRLTALLADDPDQRVRQAAAFLAAWDFHVDAGSVPAALFNVFFSRWCQAVMAERFPADLVAFLSANAPPLALQLLESDRAGWFVKQRREQAIRQTFAAALDELSNRLGPDMNQWAWGRMHQLLQKHFLSGRGDLGALLDRSGLPCGGDSSTVCSNVADANFMSYLGAGYRMVADMADPKHGFWSVEVASASGHPGSPHYDDQQRPWDAGEYHYTPLIGPPEGVVSVCTLGPA